MLRKNRPIPESAVEIDRDGAESGLAPRVDASKVRFRFGLPIGASATSSIARTVTHPRNLQREAATLSARRDARVENYLVFGVSLRLALLS